MSYIAAGAAILGLVGTYLGGQAAKEANQLEGDEFDITATRTLLTAKYNMGNIIEAGMIQYDSIKQQGADREAMLKRAGHLRTGKTVATLGASGVKIESGTAAQQIIKSRLDNSTQILKNQEELNTAISGLEYNLTKEVEQKHVKALEDYNKLKRMAKLAKEGGDTAQFASMMSGIGGAASTYKSLGGNFTEFGGGQETGGGTYQAMEAGGRMKGQSGR